jgi:hypothetical protein
VYGRRDRERLASAVDSVFAERGFRVEERLLEFRFAGCNELLEPACRGLITLERLVVFPLRKELVRTRRAVRNRVVFRPFPTRRRSFPPRA